MEVAHVTPNERIVQSAFALLRGEINAEPDHPGLCLAMVRVVIEHAFYGGRWAWYDAHRSHVVERRSPDKATPWARDMERSLTRQGMALELPRRPFEGDLTRYVDLTAALPQLQPGDLLFRWDTARNSYGDDVGHVAILMPGDLVLENVASRAGALSRGPTKLSRLGAWPVTTVVRFQPKA